MCSSSPAVTTTPDLLVQNGGPFASPALSLPKATSGLMSLSSRDPLWVGKRFGHRA